MPSPDTDAAQRRVEAARHVLLRRLVPSVRERMLANLEPIGMMAEVIARRLQQSAPDLAHIEADLGKVHGFARTAVAVNLDVVNWLAPEPGDPSRVTLEAGVQECVKLLRSDLGFRGFGLRQLQGDGADAVSCVALRTLLPAVLFALADEPRRSAGFTVTAGESGVLTIRAEADAASAMRPAHAPERPLRWDAVQALAAAEGVQLQRESDTVVLRFPA